MSEKATRNRREYNKVYRATNAESLRLKARARYEVNRAYVLERQRIYGEANQESRRQKARDYYAANRERLLEQKRIYHQANRELLREKSRASHAANREKANERRRRRWIEKNESANMTPEQRKRKHATTMRRLAALKGLTVPGREPTAAQLASLVAVGVKCVYCSIAQATEVDHFIPIARGGLHVWENLIGACRSCNASKGDRIPDVEWHGPPQYLLKLKAG